MIDFELPYSRAKVFDACLTAAQAMNLNVAVLEKQSGLTRFEISQVSPAQLDAWCEYFEVVDDGGEPISSFSNMDLSGLVSMTVLLSQPSASATAVDIRTNWRTADYYEPGPVPFLGILVRGVKLNSKHVMENEFRQRVASALAAPS